MKPSEFMANNKIIGGYMNHIANIYITIVLATMAGILYVSLGLPWVTSLVGG